MSSGRSSSSITVVEKGYQIIKYVRFKFRATIWSSYNSSIYYKRMIWMFKTMVAQELFIYTAHRKLSRNLLVTYDIPFFYPIFSTLSYRTQKTLIPSGNSIPLSSQCPISRKTTTLEFLSLQKGTTDRYIHGSELVRKHILKKRHSDLNLHIHKQHAKKVFIERSE